MRTCVFDIETRKLAQELDENIQVGWDKPKAGEGGISVIAIHDSLDNWTYFYDDTELEQMVAHLEAADIIVGYNSKNFDIPVIEGLYGKKLKIKTHVDLSELIYTALVGRNEYPRRGENSLNAVCSRTLGRTKIDKGELAPQLAREGKWARLFRYCAEDVRLTRDLYYHIEKEGGVVSINSTFLPISLPREGVEST